MKDHVISDSRRNIREEQGSAASDTFRVLLEKKPQLFAPTLRRAPHRWGGRAASGKMQGRDSQGKKDFDVCSRPPGSALVPRQPPGKKPDSVWGRVITRKLIALLQTEEEGALKQPKKEQGAPTPVERYSIPIFKRRHASICKDQYNQKESLTNCRAESRPSADEGTLLTQNRDTQQERERCHGTPWRA